MLYSPMVSQAQLDRITNHESRITGEIGEIARENNSIFYRLELDIPTSTNYILPTTYYKKSFEEMQPTHTWVLDITKSEDELMAEMNMRCRYNVRLAEKSGVKIESSDKDQTLIDNFYNLYSITGKRHGITYRNKEYFKTFLEIFGQAGYACVYNGKIIENNTPLVLTAGVLVYSGKTAIYMFGASSNEKRNLKAPNLLVWQMIKDAKAKGCERFDFFGIAPDDNPKHPWAGITSFKKQFGGEQINILGSYDMIFRRAEYQAFKILEKTRRK